MNDPPDTSRLAFKFKWFQALTDQVAGLIAGGKQVLMGGDFNVIERDEDVYNPAAYRSGALMVPPVRAAFEKLNELALQNMIRTFNPDPHTYSFWDFNGGSWPKNNGILLDFFFATENLAQRISAARIYREVRGWDKSSDHAPIGCIIEE